MSRQKIMDKLPAQTTARYQAVRGTIEETLKLLDKGRQDKVEIEDRLRKYAQRERRLQIENIRAGRPLIKAPVEVGGSAWSAPWA